MRLVANSVLFAGCFAKMDPFDLLDDPFDYDDMNHNFLPNWDHETDMFFDDDQDYDGYSSWADFADESVSTEISGDIDMEGPCKADLATHSHCLESSENRAVCLWMDNVDSVRWANHQPGFYKPVNSECKSDLIEFLTNASNHPFKYFHDLKTDCASDLSTLCSNTTKEATALGCLRSNFDSIADSSCMDEIVHLNSWTSLNETWWSPTMWKDCVAERRESAICQNRTSSGLSDFRDCLDDNRSALSDQCHRALFQSDMQAAPNPFLLRRDVASKCMEESKKFCSDVSYQDENQLFCLFRASKRHPDMFSMDCSEGITSVVTLIESDYRMNVPMRKFCRRTIDEFCPKEKEENDASSVENDAVITCLKRVYLFKEHHHSDGHQDWERAEETEACMGVMRQSVLVSSLDWEADSDLHSNCLHDYHRLIHRIATKDPTLRDSDACDNESPHQCLQSHVHDLQDTECQRAVMLHSQLSALDQDFKPQLLAACALALDHLDCDSASTVKCLYDQIESIHDQHCRDAIRHDFQLSDRDYRLSYSLSIVCESDRVALCDESADVLKCMIEKIDDIKSLECDADVSRLAFVAQSEGEDLAAQSVCASDVSRLNCQGLHGTVHACLIDNIESLSTFCSAEVLNLHRSVGSVQSLEKALNSACSHELVANCKHLTQSSDELRLTEKAECLEDEELSTECDSQLRTVQTLLSADYRTNPGLQKDCKTDLSLLCNEEEVSSSFSSKTIQCLVSHRMQIRNTNCKRHIVSTIYRMSEDVQFVPNMRKVCGDDIAKFCATVAPGSGLLHECLRENLEALSHDCQSQEFTIEQLEEVSAATRSACSFELTQSMCQRATEMLGGELHCLWRNVDDVSLGCSRATKKEMKGKIGNIWLDPIVYTRCRSIVNKFVTDGVCPSWLQQLPVPLNGLIPLPSNYTQAVGGEHVQCLGRNRAKIADSQCLSSVEALLRMEVSDPLMFRFGLRSACKRDLSATGICGESDPFETLAQWRCLQDGLANLTTSCTDSVKRVWRMSLIDVSFNPDIATNCATEITEHCDATKKGMRTIACLSQLVTAEAIDKDGSCTEAVKRLPSADVLDLTNPWNIAKKQAEADIAEQEELPAIENARLLQASSPDMGIAISGPLAVVSLASLFLVVVAGLYRLYRYKMNKGYMVIVEKD